MTRYFIYAVCCCWCDHLSVTVIASSSTFSTVATILTSTPLSTVYFSHSEQRRSSADALAPYHLRSEAPVVELSVLCVPVFELRSTNRLGVCLSVERVL